ncbi:TetR/AcrR family transcriptional regulator [Aliishimia ponticola]|uniref:TetR/AcrR family transcriptional regulator n=1 Tax=Aliishimia ponticola TaxID=2499833 RepID=A0A4S4NBL8_9RHOB|nr:TetR/AcrR family transcriptional regulator [Aliishimia ponticola]THH36065.1 TetR/AcrR family transcriptional regulator [Aliishimia ponticola]
MTIELNSDAFETAPAWTCIGRKAANPKDRVLNAATELFCHHGFAATGVDTIASRAGTAKSTLYAHFKSKEKLIDAVLEREGKAWRDWFFGRLGKIKGTPKDKLCAVFDILAEWFSDPEFYGCPFINAIGEATSENETLRNAAKVHKSHVNLWIQAQAMELGMERPDDLVREMTVLVDGAIVAAQVSRDSDFAQVAKSLIARRLGD